MQKKIVFRQKNTRRARITDPGHQNNHVNEQKISSSILDLLKQDLVKNHKKSLAPFPSKKRVDLRRAPDMLSKNYLSTSCWSTYGEDSFRQNLPTHNLQSKKESIFIPPEYQTFKKDPSLLPKFLREKFEVKPRVHQKVESHRDLLIAAISIDDEPDFSTNCPKITTLISPGLQNDSGQELNQENAFSTISKTKQLSHRQRSFSPFLSKEYLLGQMEDKTEKPTCYFSANNSKLPVPKINLTKQQAFLEYQSKSGYSSQPAKTQYEFFSLSTRDRNSERFDNKSTNSILKPNHRREFSCLNSRVFHFDELSKTSSNNLNFFNSNKWKENQELRNKKIIRMFRVSNPNFIWYLNKQNVK